MNLEEYEHLNSLLKGEIAAIETYKQAIKSINDQRTVKILEKCRDSHLTRADKLRQLIHELGHQPTEGGGMWASFAKLLTRASAAIGERAAITALEEGEDYGLSEYEWRLVCLHGNVHHIVKEELFPLQKETHRTIASLASNYFHGLWPPVPETTEV
ncbi:MAG TPA: demethoxyubiquinone hydroxylase family protein [Candidatus Obscuribacterales bacterium]